MSPEVPGGRRSTALDILRGAAVAVVIVRHWPSHEGEQPLLRALRDVGWIGVDLFFVLSGFLIAGLLFRELDSKGTVDLRRFWMRRAFKIWPAYFAAYVGALAIRFAWDAAQGRAPALPLEQWPNVVFVQNYFPMAIRWPHSWSVAIEEHFYLALPLLLTLVARRNVLWIGVAACVAGLVLRAILVTQGADWSAVYYPTHLRLDGLVTGVALAWLCRYRPEIPRRIARAWPLLVATCAGAVIIVWRQPLETSAFTQVLGFPMLALGFGGLVLLAAVRPDFGDAWRAGRAVAALGRYSYGVYLFHGAMIILPGFDGAMEAAERLGGLHAAQALFAAMSIAGGVALSLVVEQPALRLRERLTKGGRAVRPAPVVANPPEASSQPAGSAIASEGRRPASETISTKPAI